MTSMSLDDGLKAAYSQIREGSAFNRSFENEIAAVQGHVGAIGAKIDSLPLQINGVANSITDKARNIQTQITSAVTRIPDFATHVTAQFDNIMHNISTFASSQGLKNALAGKSSGCSNLNDFFGSITTLGPQIIGEVKGLADEVTSEIDRFKSLGTTLQGNIAATKSEIVNQLNAEIGSVGSDVQRLTDLNALKATVVANFDSAVAEERADLVAQAQAQLSSVRQQALDAVATEMKKIDLSILGSANGLGSKADSLDQKTQSLQSLASGETSALQGAVSELETLGAASSMRSLLNTNPCVQTLMGFVGNSSFLSNLNGH